MAIHLFTKAIFENRPIDVFNQGDMIRDFTYIDDIVEAVIRISKKRPTPAPAETPLTPNISRAPYQIFNVGSDNPIPLMNFIHLLEDEIGIQAKINYLPLQSGDISASWANVDDLNESIDFRPRTPINQGIKNFVNWFREYYHG